MAFFGIDFVMKIHEKYYLLNICLLVFFITPKTNGKFLKYSSDLRIHWNHNENQSFCNLLKDSILHAENMICDHG